MVKEIPVYKISANGNYSEITYEQLAIFTKQISKYSKVPKIDLFPISCRKSSLFSSFSIFLINSANPKSRPVGIIVFAHDVRTSVRKLQNQATITAGQDCGKTEWIIDDSQLFLFFSRETFDKTLVFAVYDYDRFSSSDQQSEFFSN